MTDDSEDGYVHDPERFDDEGDPGRKSRTTRAYVADEAPPESSFGRRGWLLVAALFVAFVVVPGFILYIPYSGDLIGTLGLTYRDAYLVLPLVPALLLGALAVWIAVGSRR